MRVPRHHVRLGIMVILLAMLLMRLVWMEMRHYRYWAPWLAHNDPVHVLTLPDAPSFPAARTSPAWEVLRQEFFPHGVFQTERFRNTAEFEIVLVVTLVVGITRLLAGSWLAALCVGVSIMSRGRLLAAVETIDPGLLMAALFSSWFTVSVWGIRTGLKRAVGLATAIGWVLMVLEPAFIPLGMAWPIMLLWHARHARPLSALPETRAFAPLPVSFPDWTKANRWPRLLLPLHLTTLVISLGGLGMWWFRHHPEFFHPTSPLPEGFTRLWIQTLAESWDIELIAASAVLLAVLLVGRYNGVPGLGESIRLILIASVLVLVGAWVADAWEARIYPMSIPSFRAGRAWLWIEPPLLTLGAVSLYQFTRLLRRLPDEFL